MEPFAHRGIGAAWLAAMRPPLFIGLMYLEGVKDRAAATADELNAYPALLKRGDGGRAFLKLMRGFERTREKEDLSTLREAPYPIQIVWGRDDPALRLAAEGAQARRAVPGAGFTALPGRHFFPEEQPAAIAELVSALASRATGRAPRARPSPH